MFANSFFCVGDSCLTGTPSSLDFDCDLAFSVRDEKVAVGEEGRDDSMSESPEEASCGILILPRYGLADGARKLPAECGGGGGGGACISVAEAPVEDFP